MSALERLARLNDKVFDRLRDKSAFTITEDRAVDGDFECMRRHTYALLVTFRRNGEPVPSPVWFAIDDRGAAYVKTAPHAGKLKRLRHDERVLLVASSARGKPRGAAVRGIGRVLSREGWAHAEATLAAKYGLARSMSERVSAASP